MSRSLRRGALAAVAALSIAPLAAACGAGQDPQTLEVKPDSVATTVGDIEIQNAFIITEPSGSGAAVVSGRVFNNSAQAQQLTSVTVQGATAQVTLTRADGTTGPITIPANGSVTLGGKGNAVAELSGSDGLSVGGFQKTVFDFSGTGQVGISPSVVPAQAYFAPYGPASASPSTSVSGAPAPGASASASVGTSASGSPAAKTTGAKSAGKGGKQSEAPVPSTSSTPKA